MMTCGEFAGLLQKAAIAARKELIVPTEAVMAAAETAAKSYIGNYQDGWPVLAESTIVEKNRLGYAPPDNPLLREGAMRDSIAHLAALSGEGAEGVVYSDSKIALYQETGTDRIPPRPFLALALFHSEPLISKLFGEFAEQILTGKIT